MNPYSILDKKRRGLALSSSEIDALVEGCCRGSWSDAQLAAFLMAVAIRGLNEDETAGLTRAMMESGEVWRLRDTVPGVVDKHSTGGVGDKVSLILSPLLAACGVPVAMLTGRALGHTGGTADKLESIPGLRLDLNREQCVRLLETVGMAIGIATADVAPADRRLYGLRDHTGTVSSAPLIVASILSKKLATGAAAIVFDVKTGSGAFFEDPQSAVDLARDLTTTCSALGVRAGAVVSDMNQPLGSWVGNAAEVLESLEILQGDGDQRLRELVIRLSQLVAGWGGHQVSRAELEAALADGRAYDKFLEWAKAAGAQDGWHESGVVHLAPLEIVVSAGRGGWLAAADTRGIGILLGELSSSNGKKDLGVALRWTARLGDRLQVGQEIARLFIATETSSSAGRAAAAHLESLCTIVDQVVDSPPLIHDEVPVGGGDPA